MGNINYKNFVKGVGVVPKSTTDNSALGDVEVLSSDNKIHFHNGTINDSVVTEAATATITNKTIAAGSNTISGLTNSNLSGTAAVTNANLAAMAAHTFKGNNTGSSVVPLDLTVTQATAELNVVVGDSGAGGTKGLVPAPAAGDALANKVLGAGGSWITMSRGGGSKNYLTTYTPSLNPSTPNIGNGDFELNATTGFSLFNTTLTSGIPTGSITAGAASITTFAATASSPIENKYSLNIASTGAIAAAAGWISDAFYIDQSDQAKILGFQIKYSVISGSANINQSGTSSNTFAVYIYDVTNSVWIQPAGVYNMVGNGNWVGTFQTSSNGTNYRIAVMAVNASGGAASLNFDSYVVGPQVSVNAPAGGDYITSTSSMTSLVSATTTSPTFGTSSINRVQSRRNLDSKDYVYELKYTSAGTGGTGDYLFSLPPGDSFDSTKTTFDTGGPYGSPAYVVRGTVLGVASGDFQSTDIFQGVIIPYDSTRFRVSIQKMTNGPTYGAAYLSSSIFSPVGTSGSYFFKFSAPLTGLSSNTVSSADTDTRVVSFGGTQASQAVTANVTDIAFTTVKDTHGAWSGTIYTVLVSGDYVASFAGVNSTAGGFFDLYLNGSHYQYGNYQPSAGQTSGGTIFMPGLKSGDLIKLRAGTTGTITLGSFGIFKLSGPAVVQAVESVNVRYHASATSISGSLATVVWTAKDFDSHGAMNPATGVYTCLVSGKYQVNASLITGGTFSLNNAINLQIQKNGSVYTEQTNYAFASATNISVNVSDIIQCNQGDTIQAQVSSTAVSPSIAASNSKNWISISRVGN